MSLAIPGARRRRWRVVLIVSLLGVLALWLLRSPVLGPLVASQLSQRLSQALGGPVEVRRAQGGWLHDAEIEGVSSQGQLPGPLRHLEVERLAIRHRLRLLRGDMSGLSVITASGVRAEVVISSDRESSGTAWTPVVELLPDPLPELDLGGSLSLRIAGELLDIPGLSLVGGGKHVALALHGLTVHGLPAQNLTLTVVRRDRATLMLAEPVQVGDLRLDHLELTLGRERQQIIANLAAYGGRIAATVTPEVVDVTLDDIDLAALPGELLARLRSQPISGRMTATVKARRDPQAPGGWAVLANFSVAEGQVAGRTIRSLHGFAALTARGVRISDLSVAVDGGTQIAVADLEIEHHGGLWLPRRGHAALKILDLRPWMARLAVPTAWHPTQPTALTAQVQLANGTVSVDQLRVDAPGLSLAGSLVGSTLSIERSELVVQAELGELARQVPALAGANGTVAATLRYSGGVPWTLPDLLAGTARVDLTGNDLVWQRRHVPRLALVAQSDRGAVVVSQAETTIAGMALRGTGRARLSATGWTVEPCTVTFPGGTLTLSATLNDAVQVAAALDVTDLSAATGRRGLDGRLSATLAMEGDPLHPAAQLLVTSTDVQLAGQPATLELAVHQDAQGVHLRRCAIDLADKLEAEGSGFWPATFGRRGMIGVAGTPTLALTATVADLSTVAGSLLDSGSAHLSLRADGGELALRGLRLHLADANRPGRRIAAPLPLDADLRLRIGASALDLTISAALDGLAVLSGELSSPGALDLSTWSTRPLTGSLTLREMPLEGLIGVLPGLLHASGRISGKATCAGVLGAPELAGDLALTDGAFKPSSEVPTITAVQGTVALRGRRLTLGQVRAELGSAPALLNGTIDLDGESAPRFDLHLTGDNLLLTQSRDLRVRADTDLRLVGPLRELAVTGAVTITSGLYSRRVELIGGGRRGGSDEQLQLFALREPPLSNLRFDVQVRTSTRTADEGLRVANNLVRATTTIGMRLRGTGALPEPEGSLILREGLVTLPFSTLTVDRAEVVFPPGDAFVPTIAASARAQVRHYAVTVEVQGLLRDPEIHAASPGVSERDALLLLTAGATTAELDDPEGQRAALGRIGTFLGRETWRRLKGPSDPDAKPTPLDLLTIEIGRAVSEDGRDTIEAEMQLNQPDDPYGFFLYGERDRYDDYNMGTILRWRFGGSR